jgi:hypothetical protein
MKNSINKTAIAAFTALLMVSTLFQEAKAQSQIVNTVIQNGVIFPMVELSEVKVSANGTKEQRKNNNAGQITLTNNSKLVKIELHSGEYMPSVVLDDAIVVADKAQTTSASGLNKALQFVIGFIANYVSHYGIIQ